MTHRRLASTAMLGLAVAAVAAPTAAAQQDLRSPDATDAANAALAQRARQHQRHDLRTPDARDAAQGHGTFTAPRVTVVKVTQPSPAAAQGLDWGDVGIGSGATLAVVLLGLGGSLIVTHRRRGTTQRGPAAIS
jgi:hypothetical protein